LQKNRGTTAVFLNRQKIRGIQTAILVFLVFEQLRELSDSILTVFSIIIGHYVVP
jgi:hypothetical protein